MVTPPRLTWLLVAGVALPVVACDSPRTLTREDCAEVRRTLRSAWRADGLAAAQAAERRDLRPVVGDVGSQLEARWTERCAEHVGKPIDPRELHCLKRARSIDEVRSCGAASPASSAAP